jgi:hypothetical protein
MKHEQLTLGDVIEHIKRTARDQGANVNPRDVVLYWDSGPAQVYVQNVRVRLDGNGNVAAYLGNELLRDSTDARELVKACTNAHALLDHIQTQTGQTYSETLDLEIATENAETCDGGLEKVTRADIQLLLGPARAALARLQQIQADDIAKTEEWDALPYPEADTLENALAPFAEVQP